MPQRMQSKLSLFIVVMEEYDFTQMATRVLVPERDWEGNDVGLSDGHNSRPGT